MDLNLALYTLTMVSLESELSEKKLEPKSKLKKTNSRLMKHLV